MSQFNDYATKSKWSPIINLGCDDRLRGRQPRSGMTDPQCHAAYMHGWHETDAAENKAGRPMPEQKIANREEMMASLVDIGATLFRQRQAALAEMAEQE